jgi:hypothetical protein
MVDGMTKEIQLFKPYIKCLAEGKLDAYLDSVCRSDKHILPTIKMSTHPNLLLHRLGERCDMKKINELFSECTVYFPSLACMALLDMLLTGICTTLPVQARLDFPWRVFATSGGSILHVGKAM